MYILNIYYVMSLMHKRNMYMRVRVTSLMERFISTLGLAGCLLKYIYMFNN
jgi:hypothetical protein